MPEGIDFSAELSGPQKGLLVDIVVGLFGDQRALDFFLKTNGLPGVAAFGEGQQLAHIALAVVEHAWVKGDLDGLVDGLFRESPRSPLLRNFSQKFNHLARPRDVPPPPPQFGAAARDPLEWFIREGGFASPLKAAEAFAEASGRVGRIHLVHQGKDKYGTGFLVGPDLLLTAYHVVESLDKRESDPEKAVVTFGFVETNEGLLQKADNVRLAPGQWLLEKQPYSDSDLRPDAGQAAADELDFALMRLSQRVGETRGWYALKDVAATPPSAGPVFIFQHPRGEAQQFSFGWILSDEHAPHRVRYDANTFCGSSGGLVLDGNMRPIALHHSGEALPVAQPPEFNQGIPLAEIYAATRQLL
jgi:hypothetical protein